MATFTARNLDSLRVLNHELVACVRCPRLVAHLQEIGRVQRRAYRGHVYWSRPVPAFGDPAARLLIIGLAPGAHGSNRTGRMFTGDKSGEYLYRALWETGFANRPDSLSLDDGLRLQDAYITAAVRCAPPDNKPTREEMLNCRPFLLNEIAVLRNVRVIVALGAIALDAYLSVLHDRGLISSRAPFRFGHAVSYRTHPGGPLLLASYHPSQQNTSTRRLTREMLRDVFLTALQCIEGTTSAQGPMHRAVAAAGTSEEPG